MTTINQLVRRMESKYLEPVTEETASAPLVWSITDSDLTFTLLAGVMSPDEESYIGPGRLLELESELVRVITYNQATREVTCERGMRDTINTAHAAGIDVRIPTRFPRKDVIEAIQTAIESLWQPLMVMKEDLITVDTAGHLPLPLSTVRIISVEVETTPEHWTVIQSRLMNPYSLDTSIASVRVARNPYARALALVKYGVKVVLPDGNDDEIVDLPAKWERIVLTDAAAELLSGVDIDAVTQEFLTQTLRLEQFPVRSGASISQSLIRYREYLIDQASKDIKGAYPRRIVHKRVSIWK